MTKDVLSRSKGFIDKRMKTMLTKKEQEEGGREDGKQAEDTLKEPLRQSTKMNARQAPGEKSPLKMFMTKDWGKRWVGYMTQANQS